MTIQAQLARKAELLERIAMLRNHLGGVAAGAVGTLEDWVDPEREMAHHYVEIAHIDACIARTADSNG